MHGNPTTRSGDHAGSLRDRRRRRLEDENDGIQTAENMKGMKIALLGSILWSCERWGYKRVETWGLCAGT
jgi:hypothetical protein